MASKRLLPLLDRVLIRKVQAPEQSVGGILLPESAAKVSARQLSSRVPSEQSPN